MKKYCLILCLYVSVSCLFSTVWASERITVAKEGMVEAHNAFRASFDIPGLIWSDELAECAVEWAEYLAKNKNCTMQHRPKKGNNSRLYGENLFWASAVKWSDGRREVQKVDAGQVVGKWFAEKKYYNYQSNQCRAGKACGHYTQVIWKDSLRVGCGFAVCRDKSQVWVCNYDPPGNFVGEKPY